jgi:uncharacterized repeat protein (TIGR01451 family)
MAYEDNTAVTIENTDTAVEYWNGTLNAGEEHKITSGQNRYYTITSDKTVTVCVLPLDGWTGSCHHGTYMPDKSGSGIGTEFYTPSASGGYLWTFAYGDGTTVNVYDAATNTLVGTHNLDKGDAANVNPGYGYWHIVSDNLISVYEGWGQWQASFAPVLFGESVGGYWAESIEAMLGDTARFRISVHNDGNFTLEHINVSDFLPPSLDYANNAIVNGVPTEPTETWNGGKNIAWVEPFVLAPDAWGHIEFDATVVICDDEDINTGWASGYCYETGETVIDEDTATVFSICEEPVLYEISGAIYNELEETGICYVYLFDQIPDQETIPINETSIPSPGPYTFQVPN